MKNGNLLRNWHTVRLTGTPGAHQQAQKYGNRRKSTIIDIAAADAENSLHDSDLLGAGGQD